MKIFVRTLIFTSFMCPIFTFTIDTYIATALPSDFFINGYGYSLNNKGEIVGYVQPKIAPWLKDNTNKPNSSYYLNSQARAAYWSTEQGLILIPETMFPSAAITINESGNIACFIHENDSICNVRSLIWDIDTKRIKFGPAKKPSGIDNEKNIIIGDMIWHPYDNTIDYIKNNNTTNLSRLCTVKDPLNSLYSQNKKGSRAFFNKDIFLTVDGKTTLLILLESRFAHLNQGSTAVWINNNDQVIAITYTLSATENIYAQPKKNFFISKWDKAGNSGRSEILSNIPELKDYYYYEIKGFNDNGQILIQATNINGKEPRLFLLSLQN